MNPYQLHPDTHLQAHAERVAGAERRALLLGRHPAALLLTAIVWHREPQRRPVLRSIEGEVASTAWRSEAA